MIRVEDIRKAYGNQTAVAGVSFAVSAGETFGLLGPNGAGKTTTLHMLVGALNPDSGSVLIGGAGDPTKGQVRRTLGIAPQANALYEDLTGFENLRFFGSLYGFSSANLRERVRWALDFVGLADRGKDAVSTYSGGMKRRLNLAVALVADPQVVFLDEPTVGVDPQSRNHVFDNIETLKKQGKTILYTTHYMEEAERLCDRVAIMDRGKILALDTVPGLIAAHGGESVVEIELAEGQEDVALPQGSREGNVWRIRTLKPDEEMLRVVQAGLRFVALRVVRPDLESVFLNLTGRRLRD
jgi:ABC-2 type transport system ATP-binding protein